MPLRVRCDPQLPKMMQREHRDEATDVLPATFLNEAIRLPIQIVALQTREMPYPSNCHCPAGAL